ncbi:MAG: extracellular solute-binding protein [Clostridia bacterium]|nr:extracellular solute-binding protein [Clostridia bacterium]
MMKKSITSILVLLLAAGLVVSCSSTSDKDQEKETTPGETSGAAADNGDDTAGPTADTSALDQLKTDDFGGYTFSVLAVNDAANNRHYDIQTAGEENGDLLNDLVYNRNRAVEEKYNITLKTSNDDFNAVTEQVRQQVHGGLHDYDLYLADSHVAKLAAEGFFADMNSIDTLGLTNPWWSQNALQSLSVEGKVYFMTGDINPTTMMSGGGLVFNKKLFADHDLAYPYETVRSGKWTIDALLTLTKDMSQDMNGDNAMNIEDDLYSMSGWCASSPYSFFYGMGGMMSEKNNNDIPVLRWDADQISGIYEKLYELIITQQSYFVTDVAKYDTNFKCFSDGHAYFNQISLLTVDRNLRDMQDDYGILPMPKYDESQKNYASYVNAASNFAMIPSNTENASRTGMITEALAAGAYDMVTPSLYEIITKSRNVRDEESAEMVSIITSSIVFDPFYLNLLDGYSLIQEQLIAKNANITSAMESKRSAAEKAMEKLVEAFQSIE